MDKNSSPRDNTAEEGSLSCWGHLKLKLPWTRKRIDRRPRSTNIGCDIMNILKWRKSPKPVGGFRYDPLSYAQNFDQGCWDDDNDDDSYRGFSSRFAAPSSKSL